MDGIIELDRRISKALERGKGLQLSDEELDLLVASGAIDALKQAATKALVELAAIRQQERADYRERMKQPRSKAAQAEDVQQAIGRAQRLLKSKARVPASKLPSNKI